MICLLLHACALCFNLDLSLSLQIVELGGSEFTAVLAGYSVSTQQSKNSFS
jgi:hypothetical protein